MKNESKRNVLNVVKNIALKENSKATEAWPPCAAILYQPKRKNK